MLLEKQNIHTFIIMAIILLKNTSWLTGISCLSKEQKNIFHIQHETPQPTYNITVLWQEIFQ